MKYCGKITWKEYNYILKKQNKNQSRFNMDLLKNTLYWTNYKNENKSNLSMKSMRYKRKLGLERKGK